VGISRLCDHGINEVSVSVVDGIFVSCMKSAVASRHSYFIASFVWSSTNIFLLDGSRGTFLLSSETHHVSDATLNEDPTKQNLSEQRNQRKKSGQEVHLGLNFTNARTNNAATKKDSRGIVTFGF
jgi:hypothetical protein